METAMKSKRLLSKKRRRRTIINSRDLERLESVFKTSKWPDKTQKGRLSKAIGKTENFISTWFQNRRARMRRLALQKDILDDVDINNVNMYRQQDVGGGTEEKTFVKNIRKCRPRSRSVPPMHQYMTETEVQESLFQRDNLTSLADKPYASLHFEDQGQSSEEIKIFKANLETAMTNFQFHGTSSIDTHQSTSIKQEETTPLQTLVTKGPNDVVLSERRDLVGTTSFTGSSDATSWDNVFRRIVDMMAASESIMSKSDSSFPFAVKDAALGIRLKDGKIFYHKDYGLDFEEYD